MTEKTRSNAAMRNKQVVVETFFLKKKNCRLVQGVSSVHRFFTFSSQSMVAYFVFSATAWLVKGNLWGHCWWWGANSSSTY